MISFWLKQVDKVFHPKIVLTVRSTDMGTKVDRTDIFFDNSAYGWQLVEIPIRITNRNISSIDLQFEDAPKGLVMISDMRLKHSLHQDFFITGQSDNRNNWLALNDIIEIRYRRETWEFLDISPEYYFSEADLEMTYLSYFEARDNSSTGNDFILSVSDNTKKFAVNAVSLSGGGLNLDLTFRPDENGGNTRAGYSHITESPDGNLIIEGRPHFIRNHLIDNVKVDCIRQRTIATRKDTVTTAEKIYDLQGNKRLEVNEAGVSTIYHYDNNSIVNRKIIQSNTGERIISDATTSSNLRTETHPNGEIKVEKKAPFGSIERSSYNGRNEKGRTLVTNL